MQEASELATLDADDDFVAAPLEVRSYLPDYTMKADEFRLIFSNGMWLWEALQGRNMKVVSRLLSIQRTIS